MSRIIVHVKDGCVQSVYSDSTGCITVVDLDQDEGERVADVWLEPLKGMDPAVGREVRLDEYHLALEAVMATEPAEYWEDHGLPLVVALHDIHGSMLFPLWIHGDGSYTIMAPGRKTTIRTAYETPEEILWYFASRFFCL